MTSIAEFLTGEELRAVETADNGTPEECRRLAADSDQDTWVPLFLEGCADMAEGLPADALARWMASVDMLEDTRDMAILGDAIARSVAKGMLRWEYPAHLELSGLTALSHGMSPLMGLSESTLLCAVLEDLSGMVSEDDLDLDAEIMQSASAVAYMVVMFGRDIRDMREAAGWLQGIIARSLDAMEGAGRVPESLDSLPLSDLRNHMASRMLVYDTLVSEYDAVSDRFTDGDLDALAAYWSGARGDRLLDMMTKAMDLGVIYSDTCDRRYGKDCAKAVRMLVLKYLRIRK